MHWVSTVLETHVISELFVKTRGFFTVVGYISLAWGNFIDIANNHGAESEKMIVEWMENRGTCDQRMISTQNVPEYRVYD